MEKKQRMFIIHHRAIEHDSTLKTIGHLQATTNFLTLGQARDQTPGGLNKMTYPRLRLKVKNTLLLFGSVCGLRLIIFHHLRFWLRGKSWA